MNAHNADKVLIRAKDIGLLVAILTLIGMIVGPLKKVYQWDAAVIQVTALEAKVDANSQNIAVTQSQYQQISKQLDQVNWQLNQLLRRTK